MTEPMSPREFKYGLLRLADSWMEGAHARQIAAAYIDASDEAKRDLSDMLRDDLAKLDTVQGEPRK